MSLPSLTLCANNLTNLSRGAWSSSPCVAKVALQILWYPGNLDIFLNFFVSNENPGLAIFRRDLVATPLLYVPYHRDILCVMLGLS